MYKSNIRTIELILISLLGAIKLTIFYRLIGYSSNIVSVVAGVLFIIAVFMLLDLLKEKLRDSIFFIFYILFSVLAFADVVFFNYFNQLTSIVVVAQTSQLGAVTDCIKYLLKIKYFVLLLDIPVILIYLIMKYKNRAKESYIYRGLKKAKLPALIACLMWISFLVIVDKSSENISFRKQEFFTYHANDLFVNIISDSNNIENEQEMIYALSMLKKNGNDDKYNGIALGKNLIVIQVESLQNFVIGREYNNQELTPNLNRLLSKDSFYFDRYYQLLGRGNTSDAEFTTHNSLYPAMDGQTYTKYQDNEYYGLPWLLRDIGYSTTAMHGYKGDFWNRKNAYPKQGFQKFYDSDDYTTTKPIGFGINDKEFFSQSIDYIKQLKDPYYAFLVTLTSHTPYEMPEDTIDITLKEEDEGTLFGKYLQSINYVDKAIGEFIQNLKDQGLYEDTVIAIYGDHYGLSLLDETNKEKLTKYLGKEYKFDEMMRIPLIIHVPDSGINEKITTVGSELDFYPTILNLFGLENKKGLMLGQDLVNAKSGFVAQQTYMLKGSFIKDGMIFNMSRDGIYKHSKAWNYDDNSNLDINTCRDYYKKAIKDINLSNYILKNDLARTKQETDNRKLNNLKDNPNLIAHAGGSLKGQSYTNCLEALNNSYKNNFKLMELDFEWTTDERLVCLHSWDGFAKKFFNHESGIYSYEEYKNFTMINDWHQLDLESLVDWIREHKDAKIVTDVKKDNKKALQIISKKYPDILGSIIPQIYSLDEYIAVQGYGYKDIILTLYMSNYSDEQLIDFVNRHDIYAITMPLEKAKTELPKKLGDLGVYTYTHTINNIEDTKVLEQNGIDGFYTDNLVPKDMENRG
ncbi:sulfatase-like hydrolase/transferase [Clostridiaceae bacterium M8S5]|nr:sulfatase-like hydrolase/transferase [Clostridiaceae bacterium M8S5]